MNSTKPTAYRHLPQELGAHHGLLSRNLVLSQLVLRRRDDTIEEGVSVPPRQRCALLARVRAARQEGVGLGSKAASVPGCALQAGAASTCPARWSRTRQRLAAHLAAGRLFALALLSFSDRQLLLPLGSVKSACSIARRRSGYAMRSVNFSQTLSLETVPLAALLFALSRKGFLSVLAWCGLGCLNVRVLCSDLAALVSLSSPTRGSIWT